MAHDHISGAHRATSWRRAVSSRCASLTIHKAPCTSPTAAPPRAPSCFSYRPATASRTRITCNTGARYPRLPTLHFYLSSATIRTTRRLSQASGSALGFCDDQGRRVASILYESLSLEAHMTSVSDAGWIALLFFRRPDMNPIPSPVSPCSSAFPVSSSTRTVDIG